MKYVPRMVIEIYFRKGVLKADTAPENTETSLGSIKTHRRTWSREESLSWFHRDWQESDQLHILLSSAHQRWQLVAGMWCKDSWW